MEIELRNIHKAFGSNQVLNGVNLKLKSGEVHALMGENGAGKSTLMNILTGIHKQDQGQIFVDGKEVSFKNPLEAEAADSWGVLDFKKMRQIAEEKCKEISI